MARSCVLVTALVALLGVPPACSGTSDPVDPRLLALLPDDLQYLRTPIDEDRNGYPLVRQAAEQVIKCPAVECAACGQIVGPGPMRQHHREWVAENGAALALMDAAARAPDFQLPPFDLESTWASVRDAFALKVSRARLRMERREWRQAADDLADAFTLGQRMIDGDPVLLTFLVGSASQECAVRGVRRLASLEGVPEEVLAELIRLLETTPPLCTAFAGAVRVELTTFLLPGLLIDDGSDDPGWNRLATTLLRESACEPAARCRAGLTRLLRDHPQPFDPEDTVRITAQVATTSIERCRDASLRREDSETLLDRISGPFPRPLGRVLARLISGGELKASTQRIHALAPRFGAMTNPIGRFLVRSLDLLVPSADRQAERAATLTLLAARVYEDRTGEPPETLRALVDAGILSAVPEDPFANRPMRYDPPRRLVWSVGEDGLDAGAFGPGGGDGSDDLRWSLVRTAPRRQADPG